MVAVLGLLALGGIAFLVLRPSAASEPSVTPPQPRVVKPPMVRAPPPELTAASASAAAPPAIAMPDASVEEASAAPDASVEPDPLKVPKIFHHPPPPRSMGARFVALERRYNKAREAWAVVRSHKNPAEQLMYDALLQRAGNDLSVGSKQAGAAELQEFVTKALDGVEP